MKRILATITTTILLVVVMSTAVYAAPATVGGTTTINAENFETKPLLSILNRLKRCV